MDETFLRFSKKSFQIGIGVSWPLGVFWVGLSDFLGILRVYTMSHPLENTWLKLKRADKNLNEVQRKFDSFAARCPYRSIRNTDVEGGYHVYNIHWLRNPPRSVGPVIGDAIHDMRSALDNLAWALALNQYSETRPENRFPIV